MNKLITLAFVLLIQLSNAQNTRYWIVLKDKNASTYSLKQPSEFLSAKALQRRERQHIALTSNDLPVSPAYVQEIRKSGVKIISCSKWFNTVSIVTDDVKKIEDIKQLSFVREVKKITSAPAKHPKFEDEEIIPINTQALKIQQTNMTLDYGQAFKQAEQIGITCLHAKGYLGEGVTVAVLDAGFLSVDTLPAFDSLIINKRLLGTRDFVTGDTMVFEDNSHGMMVLSCMAGYIPGQIIGTAPKAKYWLIRTEEAASESIQEEMNWAVGAEFADSVGADVINTSLGYSLFDNASENHTYADMNGNTTMVTKAADIAASKGIFVTVSAGNAAGPPWYKITSPADADSVLAVGAIDSTGQIASFSSRGPSFDGRIKPNTVARGLYAVVSGIGGGIAQAHGTSFASPITAGAVACLLQANTTKTNIQLLKAIQESASQYVSPDSIKGNGIPDFCKASSILTGIENYHPGENVFTIYPNPFHHSFSILYASKKEEIITIELRDVAGRILKSQKEKVSVDDVKLKFTYDGVLANGVYVINIITAESVFYKKIIKE